LSYDPQNISRIIFQIPLLFQFFKITETDRMPVAQIFNGIKFLSVEAKKNQFPLHEEMMADHQIIFWSES